MKMLVAMIIICFVPDGSQIKEAWRITKNVSLEHCITMNKIFASGARLGAITVKCDPDNLVYDKPTLEK